jgi:hypothetical protein
MSKKKKSTQPGMFKQGEDLPLFSGTAPRATVKPFVPRPVPRQPLLPGLDRSDDRPHPGGGQSPGEEGGRYQALCCGQVFETRELAQAHLDRPDCPPVEREPLFCQACGGRLASLDVEAALCAACGEKIYDYPAIQSDDERGELEP